VRAGSERAEILKELNEVLLPVLVEKAFPKKMVEQPPVEVNQVQKMCATAEEIQLGRYYGRVDNLNLMDELSAARSMIRNLIGKEKDQSTSLALVEYKGLRETRRR
jgi:hypothetical protein